MEYFFRTYVFLVRVVTYLSTNTISPIIISRPFIVTYLSENSGSKSYRPLFAFFSLNETIISVMCPFYGVFQIRNFVTDIGTEELAHLEMVSTIVHQLTRNLSMEEIEESGFANYYVDHTVGIWPMAAGGIPFNSCEFQSKGDAITDLFEDMAADGTIIYIPTVMRRRIN